MKSGFGGVYGIAILTGVSCYAWSGHQAAYATWRRAPATTERMTQRLEQAATQLQSEAPLARIVLSDVAYPGDQRDYRALDGNAVLLISALVRDRAEIPLRQVLVVAGDKATVLTRVYSVRSDQTGSTSLPIRTFGPYREDILCLLPVRLRMQPADLVVDLGGTKGRLRVTSFGAAVPPQVSSVITSDTPGNGPSEQVLDRFIRAEFPGVLDPPRAKRSKPAAASELGEIEARGRQIADYDAAAWHATDAVQLLGPQHGSTSHYIAMEEGGRWTVVFGMLDEARGEFQVVYEAVQEEDHPNLFRAKKLDPAREDSGLVLFRARAIETARADFGPWDRPYNVAIVPASERQLFVYLMPAQTENNIFPLGGDVRYLISRDGTTILEKRHLHRATVEFRTPSSGEMDGSFHTAVLDDAPEDTDVFHVLARRPSVPELVLTPQYVYRVQTDGTVRYFMETEPFMKILNQTK